MHDEHAMTFLGAVVPDVLDVLDDEILACGGVTVVEHTVGGAAGIDRCEFHVLPLLKGGNLHPSEGLALPGVERHGLIAVDQVIAAVHQTPVFHGLVVTLHEGTL